MSTMHFVRSPTDLGVFSAAIGVLLGVLMGTARNRNYVYCPSWVVFGNRIAWLAFAGAYFAIQIKGYARPARP